MAIRALIEIREWRFNGANLEIEFLFHALNGPTQCASGSTPHANVTATNFIAGVKSLLITYAQNQYGVTLTADEIVLR
jgi:hypothetical protein